MSDIDVDDLRRDLAMSCRILAETGCVREITGHVSARIPGTDEILVRCRPLDDPGVRYTTAADILRVGLDATNGDLPATHRLPGEFPIHSELYRARPEVGSVVHGHPRASLLCGLLGLPLLPIIGAYDPAAMDLAVKGVATYPRSVLISTQTLGVELAETMESSDAALLIGHGVVTVGEDIVTATMRAVKLETLCDLTLAARSVDHAGAPALSERDVTEVSDFVDSSQAVRIFARWTWDYYVRALGAGAELEKGA
jgi:ribulose-5-phosphate 4-epimerase/fuculose-1-phosphate aldolase